jgi:hypothetical protein
MHYGLVIIFMIMVLYLELVAVQIPFGVVVHNQLVEVHVVQ